MSGFSFAHLMGARRPRATEDTPTEEPEDDTEETSEADPDEANDDDTAADDAPQDDHDAEDGDTANASAFARGRAAERARCAAILGNQAAAGNVAAACELAFNTSLTAKQAAAVLSTLGPSAKTGGGLAQAMASLGGPQVGSDGPSAGQGQGAAKNPLVSAFAKETGARPRSRH